MPQLGAPDGRVVLPGPGIDDEVTKIDANSPTARGATPQRPVFDRCAMDNAGFESPAFESAVFEKAAYDGTVLRGADPAHGDSNGSSDGGSGGVPRGHGAPPRHRPHTLHPHPLQHPDEIAGIETRAGASAASRVKPDAETRGGRADEASRAEAEPEPVIAAESIIAAEAVKDAPGAIPADAAEQLNAAAPRPHGPHGPHGLRGAFRLVRDLITRTYRRGVEIELMHRAFGFAALGFVTLVPLLIVVAAAAPLGGRSFPAWAIAGLGLSGRAASAVNGLFGPAARVLSTTTALSAAVLAVFGLSFVSVVQTGMARVWELPAARLLSVWRQVIWLAVLIGLLIVGADLLALLHDGWFITTLRWCATAAGSLVFFWWTQHFLLESRVPWRALLPGAVLTVAGLVGLRVFSAVIFGPLIVSSAITYGAIGAVLIVVSWLIGIGYVIFGAALVGRVLYEVFGGRA